MAVRCISCGDPVLDETSAVQEAGGSWYHKWCWQVYLKECKDKRKEDET